MEGFQPNHHHHHPHNQNSRGGGGRGRRRRTTYYSNPPPNYYQNSTTTTSSSNSTSQSVGSSSNRVDDSSTDEQGLSTIVGTCPFMCPAGERAQRERLRDLAVFERLDGNPGKTSSSLAVKKFCRTISTKHVRASDMRPLPVLEDTLDYLLSLLHSEGCPFEVLHDFIFDRTRSIRQDLSMQNIVGDRAIRMYERMVKFHIISHHRLQRRTGSSDISPMHHLNLEQLTKALASLYNLYDANRASHSISVNETEFRSFYVLLHLGSDSQPTGEALSLWFRQVPYDIIKSKEMNFARRLLRYFRLGNYKRFIQTTEAEASYLQYYIIEPYISEVRAFALSCVNFGGYKLHPYPLKDISKHLLMEESDVQTFCNDCGLKICTSEAGMKLLPTKQTDFCISKGGFQNYYPLNSERLARACVDLLG